MELRQLEAFFAVMGSGSVTAAGVTLGRSQPAITRLIQDLEAELGYTLFERRGPRISPTDRAFLLYEAVERTLVSVRHLQEHALSLGDQALEQPLYVASIPALAVGLLPEALKRLIRTDLPPQVSVRGAPAEQVVHAVLSRTVDVGIASLPIEHPGLDLHWIGELPCVAVMLQDDPLAAYDVLPLAELQGRRLITVSNPNRMKGRIDVALRAAGVTSKAFIETNSSMNAIFAARSGLGIAVVEGSTLLTNGIEGVAVRRLDVDIPFYFSVITPIAKPLTARVERVLEALRVTALEQGFKLHDASSHTQLTQRMAEISQLPASQGAGAPHPLDPLDHPADTAAPAAGDAWDAP